MSRPAHSLLSFLLLGSSLLACDPGSDNPVPETPSGPSVPTVPVGGAGSSAGGAPAAYQAVTDDTWTRSGPTPVEQHGQLAVMGTSLVNDAGEAVQLKGVSSMWLNWENDGYAENPEAVAWMRDHWNISLIRAAMGIEPTGAFLSNPDKAKQQLRNVVDSAIAAGIYVLIDWHDHNAHLHQEEAVAFFREISAEYKDLPNVLYETFNEPEQIDWPTVKAYHEATVAAIRENDPDNIIVLGTPNWSQYVDLAAANPVAGTNLMYTLHFYSCSHTASLRSRADNAISRGIALFTTEWGATHADGGVTGNLCIAEATNWLNWLESKKISWSAWKLDGCEPDLTCLLKQGAPKTGGWDSQYLRGHALFVRDQLRK